METFKEHAGEAKLVWATTTPIRNSGNLEQINERTERVKARNRIAAEIMKERGIPTDDLYGLVASHPEFFSGAQTPLEKIFRPFFSWMIQ